MKVRALLIDADKKSVEEIQIDTMMKMKETWKLLGSEYINTFTYKGNDCFMDETGFENNMNLFKFKNTNTWYGGKALIVNTDRSQVDWSLDDCSLDLNYVKKQLVWCSVDDEASKQSLFGQQLSIENYQEIMKKLLDSDPIDDFDNLDDFEDFDDL